MYVIQIGLKHVNGTELIDDKVQWSVLQHYSTNSRPTHTATSANTFIH
jgi:hypothetical protein